MRGKWILSAVVVLVPMGIIAEVENIAIAPFPIVVGYVYEYEISIEPGQAAGAYSIEWRCTQGGTGNWQVFGTGGNPYYTIEGLIGNQDVKGGACISDGGFGCEWNYLIEPITVLGPTRDAISSDLGGASTALPPTAEFEVQFAVLNGDTPIGPWTDGYAQERIRQPGMVPPYDSGWVGTTGGTEGEFGWDGYHIYDFKKLTVDEENIAWWNNMEFGQVYDVYYQQNRMMIKDCFGVYQPFYFAEREFGHYKIDHTHFGTDLIE